MPAGGSGSRPDVTAVAGRLSMLLQELARAPGDDLHRAWQRRLQPGDVVGRFEILREIGRGGFGVVYEALDQQLGRSVAFKTLRPARSSHELSADWILKEAEAVARLDHPAIVTLHEVGTCDSGPYLVEELLRGQTLEERLRGGPLSVGEAVSLGLEIGGGLAHAHGRGVLHRDLKPGNVFLTDDGRVKLLDFGLAHLLGTRGVQGAGTPAYMAPEQLRGEAADARADVFALGATLFEALTGKPAFEVRNGRSAVLDRGPPPAPLAGTAAPLARMLERCLSVDPARRPASGQAVVEELLAVQRDLDRAGLGGRASPAGTAGQRRMLRLALLLGGIAGILAGGVYLVATRGRSATETPGAATVPLPSVAVLPFADMSPGKDQEYFSDGIAEEIINALTRVEGLQVVGRTSSFSFKGKSDDLREVGRKLGAGAVLEGSIRKAGSKVRITAQLVSAANGYHLWSETYDRELSDVLALEDEIARAVVDALRVRLAGGSSPAPRTRRAVAPEAYTAYLIGKQLLRRYNVSDFERSQKAFQKAIALDPGYAPAWAGLAEATFWFSDHLPKLADIRRGYDDAVAAADRALALDPDLPQGYATRGLLRASVRWDWKGAGTDFERALRLSPGDAGVHRLYSHIVLRPVGRLTEAIAEARRATELDPLDANAWSTYAAACYADGQLERALGAYDRSIEIEPEQDYAPSRKAMLLLSLGRPAEALTWAERSAAPLNRLWAIAIAAHSLGRTEESRYALDRLIADHAEGAAYQVAWAFTARGEREKAFEWLERAYVQHDSGLLFVKTDPLLRDLRGDPRFAALVRKVGLPVP
jgi:eukaryotic-like serine/threonine-protein kinase